jgi:hypothetical protein
MALVIAFRPLMNYISSGGNSGVGKGDCRPSKDRGRRWAPMPAGGLRRTRLPVRKSLTEKSGIVGLPPGLGQDSLVCGGEAEASGQGRKNLYVTENVLCL